MEVSKTQIDRLGERLKLGSHSESDLRMLDDFRRSFVEAYEAVIGKLRQRGGSPTGRLAKSTVSIVEKLRRESIRLTQMQDIAGCRVIVGNVVEQDQFASSIQTDFPEAIIIDRRKSPSYGYRAVHIIAEISGKPIEIQVRTSLQHLWAEVSEKSSDVLDPTIKYGGGPDSWRNFLTKGSESVAAYEEFEKNYSNVVAYSQEADAAHEKFNYAVAKLSKHQVSDKVIQEARGKLEESTREMERRKQQDQEMRGELVRLLKINTDLLTGAISRLDELKRQKQ